MTVIATVLLAFEHWSAKLKIDVAAALFVSRYLQSILKSRTPGLTCYGNMMIIYAEYISAFMKYI